MNVHVFERKGPDGGQCLICKEPWTSEGLDARTPCPGRSSVEDEIPTFEAFYYGYHQCAYCLDRIHKSRTTKRLRRPILESPTEVLIPAGLQAFHEACWRELKEQVGG